MSRLPPEWACTYDGEVADSERLADLQLDRAPRGERLSTCLSAVGRAQVGQPDSVRCHAQPGVVAGYFGDIQYHMAIRRAPEYHFALGQATRLSRPPAAARRTWAARAANGLPSWMNRQSRLIRRCEK